jgi:predicted P-loop ATPase
MIAQALDGQYPNEFFLSLLSIEQGIGKTTLFRSYTLPKELHKYIIEHSLSFDDDFKLIMGQSILIIDDEMDGRSYDSDKAFKNLLSVKNMSTRRAYDRHITHLTRRCSFAGSGNNLNIVRENNNRRVIPIEIVGIDRAKENEIDLTALFIEAYNLYINDFVYNYEYSDKELLRELDEDYIQESDVDMIINEYITPPKNEKDVYYIALLDINLLLTKEYPHTHKRLNINNIGKILNNNGYNNIRKGKNKITCYKISKNSKIRMLINPSCISAQFNDHTSQGNVYHLPVKELSA